MEYPCISEEHAMNIKPRASPASHWPRMPKYDPLMFKYYTWITWISTDLFAIHVHWMSGAGESWGFILKGFEWFHLLIPEWQSTYSGRVCIS